MRKSEYRPETAADLLVRAHKLTGAEINAVLERMPKLTEQNKSIARRCLVTGEAATAVAEEFGLSQQAVSRLCQRVRERFISLAELDGMPADWVRAVVVLPKDQMREVEAMQDAAFKAHQGGREGGRS